uniref:Uncharacterized protein n=1 Tax=Anguilla anguilla TaxID=7936 RepID=A0A0E9RH30_ANGAN
MVPTVGMESTRVSALRAIARSNLCFNFSLGFRKP